MNIHLFSHVSQLEKVFFTKHLAVMLKSGLTIVSSLETLVNQTRSAAFKAVLEDVLKNVENGQTVTSALKKHPEVFDQFLISVIEVGEQSGNLAANLEFLSQQLRKDYYLKKKIQGVMMYPVIVLISTVLVAGFISYFILPQILSFFSTFQTELPLTTKILLFFATVMKDYGLLILIFLIIGLIGLRFLLKLHEVRQVTHRLILSLPIVGPFLQNVILASLCRNLGVMLKSGIPITSSLETLYKSMDNLVFKNYLLRLQKSIIRGKNISKELASSHYTFISPIVARMIGVGEKTGQMDNILLYLSDFFEDDVDNTAKNFASTIEPIMLFAIGIVVGFIALAIVSPIYELTGSIAR